jgi:hypothetical protein
MYSNFIQFYNLQLANHEMAVSGFQLSVVMSRSESFFVVHRSYVFKSELKILSEKLSPWLTVHSRMFFAAAQQ